MKKFPGLLAVWILEHGGASDLLGILHGGQSVFCPLNLLLHVVILLEVLSKAAKVIVLLFIIERLDIYLCFILHYMILILLRGLILLVKSAHTILPTA